MNRLYIVLGVLVILVLAAAFIVPHVIPWGNYRGRLELLASQALGTPVRINGDIGFVLLPAPHLVLNDLAVGPQQRPVLSVTSASADFSLIDFLRDHYSMTNLVLEHPELDLTVGKDGSLDTGIKLTPADSNAVLSVARATVEAGTLRVIDAGAGREYTIDNIGGDLTVGALRGPFGFSGGGHINGQHYTLRVTASALDHAGSTTVSAFGQPDGNAYSVDLEGTLATAGVPHFTGDFSYRQTPPAASNPNGVTGDLTFTTKLDMTPEKAVLSAFTLVPDENRDATRLGGSATVDLGPNPSFTAAVASDVLASEPGDLTAAQWTQHYDLVRLLGDLPVVPVPPIAGTLTGEVDEADFGTLALRNISLDASTDGQQWSIKTFTGQLPGDTTVKLAGSLAAPDGTPSFAGTLSIASDRLDALAALWRKPASGNPLFNMKGSFDSKVSLSQQSIALTDGHLVLDGKTHLLTALVNFGAQPNIDFSGQFSDLSVDETDALLALAPDVANDPTAELTFPQGAISLTANSATLFGLPGKRLDLEGKWDGSSIEISRFAADDLGGAKFDLALGLGGTLSKPRIAADGTIGMAAAGGPALDMLFATLATPPQVRALLKRSLPFNLKAHLDGPDGSGGQGLSLTGKAGAADATFVATLDGGLLGAATAPVDVTLNLQSNDATALTSQLGLGDVSLLGGTGPMLLTASVSGDPADAMATSLNLSRGGDAIGFDGNINPGGLRAVAGGGKLTLKLSDSTALAGALGLGGLFTPGFGAKADLGLTGDGGIKLDNIAGQSGNDGFSGRLSLARTPGGASVSGALNVASLDVSNLVAGVGTPTALMASSGDFWPDGPISLGDGPRPTTGSVRIETPEITRQGQPFLTDAGFDVGWDATNTAVHEFSAKLGQGTLALDANICCAGPIADKRLSGQLTLQGADLASLLPPATAATLSGTLDGSARFLGTGDSVDALLGSLSGDGSYAVSNLNIAKFNPATFASVAAIGDIVNVSEGDLTAKVATAIDQGSFAVPKLNGGFTIAGGTVNLTNVGAQTEAARLFGGATLKLADLSLGGSFALSPLKVLDPEGLIGPTTASIAADLSGTLGTPVRTLDIANMVETLKVHALESEVARLERIKAADDSRAKADAAANKEAIEDQQAQQLAEQQALAAQQQAAAEQAAQQAAADPAAQQAAADAAAKQAAADAAAKQAAADAAAKQAAAKRAAEAAAPPPIPQPRPVTPDTGFTQPLNLEMPPMQDLQQLN